MRQELFDVDPAGSQFNPYDQPVVVALDIENRKLFTDHVSRRKSLPNVIQRNPVYFRCNIEPDLKGSARVGKLGLPFEEPAFADHNQDTMPAFC